METVKCEYCGKSIPKDKANEYGDVYVCDDCISEFFVRCERCDDLIHVDEAYRGFDGYLCECCHDDLFG